MVYCYKRNVMTLMSDPKRLWENLNNFEYPQIVHGDTGTNSNILHPKYDTKSFRTLLKTLNTISYVINKIDVDSIILVKTEQ